MFTYVDRSTSDRSQLLTFNATNVNSCTHLIELDYLKNELRRSNHHLMLRNEEIRILQNENKRLLQNEFNLLNAFKVLKDKLARYEQFHYIQEDASSHSNSMIEQTTSKNPVLINFPLSDDDVKILQIDSDAKETSKKPRFEETSKAPSNHNPDSSLSNNLVKFLVFKEGETDDSSDQETESRQQIKTLKRKKLLKRAKKDRHFSLKLNEPLSRKIWNSLENENWYMIRKQMTKVQREECNRLIDYTEMLITTELGHKSTFTAISKTITGYTIYRSCTKGCHSRWTIYIDIDKKEATVSYSKLCDHTFPSIDKGDMNYFTLKTTVNLSIDTWKSIKNEKNSKIKRSDLNEWQQKETNFIVEYCKNVLATEYNSLFIFEHVSKSLTGYSIYGLYKTKLNETSETSRCILNINIHKNEITVRLKNWQENKTVDE